ncbi:hypothetical protein ACS5NO_16360 [Larkinella sp. GY13]|uniref:hypothetical protein n=1 Tax=Larkinella sp. GY13 TaxID=3453720 RepID=UPI003EED3E86
MNTRENRTNNGHELVVLKLIHTVIWFFFVSVIGYILYCGLADDITIYTGIAIGLVVLEGLTLLVFSGRCPLTLIARNYSDSTHDNFDIFLPEWLTRYNKVIFTTLYLIGVILVVYRMLS